MSDWTHVAGVMRIDAYFKDANKEFDKIFGKELDFYDSKEKWQDARENPQSYMPLGSEGSLRKSIWVNPRDNQADKYVVSVFGDLRNHYDPQGIVDWFKNICKKLDYRVRNATITAENVCCGNVNWTKNI